MGEIRLKKVKSLLREEISSMISKRELKDPRIDSLSRISDISLSKDLKYAVVYISYFGEHDICDLTVNALNHSAGFIQGTLGRRLHLRAIPRLTFKSDQSIERGFKMNELLKGL